MSFGNLSGINPNFSEICLEKPGNFFTRIYDPHISNQMLVRIASTCGVRQGCHFSFSGEKLRREPSLAGLVISSVCASIGVNLSKILGGQTKILGGKRW